MDPTTIWLMAIVMLVLGVLLGILAASLFSGEDKTPANAKEEKTSPEPSKSPAALPGPPGFRETLRIWQDSDTQRVIPEIKGERVSEAHRLTPEQKNAINQAMLDLARWLKEPGRQPAAPPAPTNHPAPPAPTPAAPSKAGPTSAPKPSSTTPFADSLPAQPGLKDALMLNPFKLRKQLQEKKQNAPEIKTVIQMINDILQEQIVGTPLAKLGVELLENPDGSMHILGAGQSWSSVDEISHPEVKAALQEAVTTFNRQNRAR